MAPSPIIEELLCDLGQLAPQGYAVALHIRFNAPLFSAQTYARCWVETYTLNAYALRDPMVAWGLSTTGTTRWSEMPIPDPAGVMTHAAQFGLTYGAGIACGELSSRSIVGVARNDREYTDAEIAALGALVEEMHAVVAAPTPLTRAQLEALRCIADGHRHASAAAQLGISESALKARLAAARDRLMASTIPEAIQRAKDYRLF